MRTPAAIVLCNDLIAVPALLTLAFHHQLSAVAIPARNRELIRELSETLAENIELVELEKTKWKEQVSQLFEKAPASLGFLMTFPWKLDLRTIELPSKGFFNFHYGLLPQYRGADPLFYQIKNREPLAGLAIHRVEPAMDEGPVLMQEKIKLDPEMTYGSLRAQLANLGSVMVMKCLQLFEFSENPITRTQDNTRAVWYNKPGREDVMIDWQKMNADSIIALINACNPWNKGAGTLIKGVGIRILEAEKLTDGPPEKIIPGQIIFLNSGILKVACIDGTLLELKIIYTSEGFMSATKLMDLGVKQGDVFDHN